MEGFLTHEESDIIALALKRSEKDVLSIPNPEWHESPYPPLTKQHSVYNWLRHPDIRPLNIPQRLLALDMFKNINTIAIQCWGNILRQGESIPIHQHHEHLTDPKAHLELPTTPQERAELETVPMVATNTHYEDTKRTLNIKGDLHIVGAYHRHQVKTNVYRTPRYSLAMDVYFVDYLEDREIWGFDNTLRFLTFSRSNA